MSTRTRSTGLARRLASTLATSFLARPSSRRQHLDALDGLRGLAVMIVIASHMWLLGFAPTRIVELGGIGKSGVYLFFVLSAFLLTRPLLERNPAGFADTRLWLAYALRRILRIWPLFLVILALSWGLTRAGVEFWPYQLDTAALLRHLALREGESVLWSIPVEFSFYLWLPLVALTLAWMGHRRWPLPAQSLAVAVAVALAMLAWPPGETLRNDVRLGPYLVLFLCGSFAAAIDRRMSATGTRAWGWAGLVALAAFVLSIPQAWSALTGTDVDRRLSHHWFLYFGVIWSTLLLAVRWGPAWLKAPFASAPMRLVGIVSFSAYLWHMPVLYALRALGALKWAGVAWLALALMLVLAMASYLLFERPWRDVRLRRPSMRGEPVLPHRQ